MNDRTRPNMPALTQADWVGFKELVHRATGIALSPAKKSLLVSRLMRRLNALHITSFAEYYERVVSDLAGGELQALVNSITTNKTEFFREPHHFELLESWLRSPDARLRSALQRGLRIWCAAASTGEEPYTIAAVVRSVLGPSEWMRSSIFATDVDTSALLFAKRGRYSASAIESAPDHWLDRLFINPNGAASDEYVVRPELQERVHFGQLNLAKGGWRIPWPLDALFCRNVLIYFDRPTQLNVVRRACRLLAPHGLLFLGHSEGLTGFELGLEAVAHTAYRAPGSGARPEVSSPPQRAVSLSDAVPSRPRPYVIGAHGKVRLHLKSGMLLVLFSPVVRQTCVAYFGDDQSRTEDSAQVHGVLNSMLRALRQVGATEAEIEAKIIAFAQAVNSGQNPEAGSLRATVEAWVQQANIAVVAARELYERSELRTDLQTGRIQIRAAPASSRQMEPDSIPTAGVGN